MTRRLPDFLIVGAAKSGTTWLQRTLADHPDIGIPEQEVHYFSRFYESWPIDRYLAVFSSFEKPLIGENSNSYLTDRSAAARIKSALPEVKLIASLRHPIERSYSSYCMQIDRGRATSNIGLYLDIDKSPLPHIISNSRYYEQLSEYYRLFDHKQIHICLFDEIISKPQVLYEDIAKFLGASMWQPASLTQKFNEKGNQNRPTAIASLAWLITHSPLAGTNVLEAMRAASPVRRILALTGRQRKYPAMTESIGSKLQTYFRDDILETARLTGLNLSKWLDWKPKTD